MLCSTLFTARLIVAGKLCGKLVLVALFFRVAYVEQHVERTHSSAYVSIRQHTSAYVSIRQHTSAYTDLEQHVERTLDAPVCVAEAREDFLHPLYAQVPKDFKQPVLLKIRVQSIRARIESIRAARAAYQPRLTACCEVSIRQYSSAYVIIRQHTSAHVSIRQHTSASIASALPAPPISAASPPATTSLS